MEKKTDQVRRLVKDGDYKGALRIAKDFRMGMTKDQNSAMTRAYECMVHGSFYRQLGFDLKCEIEKGVGVLLDLYGRAS